MNKLLASLAVSTLLVPAGAAQAAPAASASACPQNSQIDCTWLTVDSTAKTATFALLAGQTGLSSGLNFNGFNEGKLTLTVPAGWTVVLRFTNKDQNLTHSAEVVDTVKPMPAGPVDPPAFPRAMTVKLMPGIASGDSDTVRFVANKAGSYMIFCGVPGHGLAGMWIRLNVSATDTRPSLAATTT